MSFINKFVKVYVYKKNVIQKIIALDINDYFVFLTFLNLIFNSLNEKKSLTFYKNKFLAIFLYS